MLQRSIALLFCLFLAVPVLAEPGTKLTQRDLMLALVEGLGWSFGLPGQPEDADYLQILGGERKFRIEVESNYAPETRIIVEEIFSFGNFSGSGWVRVPNRPTQIPLIFNLPISGEYRVKARLLRAGHSIRFGETVLKADGEDRFADVDLGRVYLQAGKQKISLAAPPRGGIDFIELEALPVTSIAPTGGWSLDKPLSFDDLAVTAMQLLALHATLPKTGNVLIFEAEDFELPKKAKRSNNRHLGPPHQGRWVSIGADPVTVELGINLSTEGVYDLTLYAVGKAEISGTINNQPFRFSPERHFMAKQAGGFFLKKGGTPLILHLPPYSGLDQILLTPHASSPEDFRLLTGLPLVGSPSQAQFNSFFKMLAAFGISR